MYFVPNKRVVTLSVNNCNVNLNSLATKEKFALASVPFYLNNWVRLAFSPDAEDYVLSNNTCKMHVECLFFDTLYQNHIVNSITEFKCNPHFHSLGDGVIVLAVELKKDMPPDYKKQQLLKIIIDHHSRLWGRHYESYVIAITVQGRESWDIANVALLKNFGTVWSYVKQVEYADSRSFVNSDIIGDNSVVHTTRVQLAAPLCSDFKTIVKLAH